MRARYVGFRLAWTVFAAWLFVTALFLFLALTPDPNEAVVGWLAAQNGGHEAAVEAQAAYREARGRNRPLWDRYVGWLVAFLTLEFGHSFSYGTSVNAVLARTIPRTLAYVVPGVLVSAALSVAVGTVAALRGGISDAAGRLLGYVCLCLPAFVAGEALVLVTRRTDTPLDALVGYAIDLPLTAPSNLLALAPAAAILGINLFGAQVLWVRTESREIAAREFVKTLRANGVARRRVYRHVVRNAASPLLALVVSEVLVVLFVTVYVVEIVLGVPGVGTASYTGFLDRDVGLVLTTVSLLVVTALTANLLQDLASSALDPRVAGGGERR
ncbi:ABC transporter permease subunit [Halorarum salinum]|uniref:ABC transporter permease n=1 Tax=Halorarum salinum TaxID=2743089 RepID=A0A7D5QNP5_9EURY|nr:ABC transporter permease [Halobaculum salinum]QLG64265.1 ABC transporter permease [Halobaculum salinum]